MFFSRRDVTLRRVLATSWNAAGLVRAAWLRLDVEKAHREVLAERTGIPATSLSAMNTGKRPMTPAMARRIVAAVPGLTVLDLGAVEDEDDEEAQTLRDRLEEAELELARVGPILTELADRVEALERLAGRAAQRGGGAR